MIKDLLPGRPAAALSVPNIAREIMNGMAAASVIATEDLAVAKELQSVLHRGLFRVYINHDVVGCEVGGALKNVVAIAAGMADGMRFGDNTKAMLITRGLAEMTRLGVAQRGDPITFSGLAGMGDLVATCMSRYSRNRWVGEQLASGRGIEGITTGTRMVAEGVRTSKAVVELAARVGVETPIADQMVAILHEGKSARDALGDLMQRVMKPELHGMASS